MRRLSTTQPFSCVTCEVEIVGSPTSHLGLPFCCAGCAADGPCICSYDQEAIDDPHLRHSLDVADPIAARWVAADRRGVVAARR